MQIIPLETFRTRDSTYMRVLQQVRDGAICVFPTDTVYGIGRVWHDDVADTDHMSYTSVRDIINTIKKSASHKMLSSIAPSVGWLCDRYAILSPTLLRALYMKYSPLTYIIDSEMPARRIMDHVIQQFVEAVGLPLICTSANISGYAPYTSIDQIDDTMSRHIDICIDGGVCNGYPSTLVHVATGDILARR